MQHFCTKQKGFEKITRNKIIIFKYLLKTNPWNIKKLRKSSTYKIHYIFMYFECKFTLLYNTLPPWVQRESYRERAKEMQKVYFLRP